MESKKLVEPTDDELEMEAGLDPKQVAVRFQNRWARWTNKQLEEYSRLKSDHAAAVAAKCRLEAKILKLKEQVSVTLKEIARLSCEDEDEDGGGGGGGRDVSSSSPST